MSSVKINGSANNSNIKNWYIPLKIQLIKTQNKSTLQNWRYYFINVIK